MCYKSATKKPLLKIIETIIVVYIIQQRFFCILIYLGKINEVLYLYICIILFILQVYLMYSHAAMAAYAPSEQAVAT